MAFNGVLVHLGANTPVSVPNSYYAANYVKVPFPTVIYDTGSFWDATNKQIIIPSNIPADTYGVFACNVRWQDSGGFRIQVLISKYDASTNTQLESQYPECAPSNMLFLGGTTSDHVTFTHPVLLEPGDAYACKAWQSGATGAAGALNIVQAGFSLHILS